MTKKINKKKKSNTKQVTKKTYVENAKKSDVKNVISQNGKKKNVNDNKVVVKKVKNKKHLKSDVSMNNEIKKLGIIIFVLIVISIVFYGITKLAINGKNNYQYNFDEETPVEIQYDEILVGEILNQNRNEYYVLLERADDVSVDLYHYYVSNYKYIKGALKVYTVDVDNPFNRGYVAEKSDLNVSNVSEMKISESVLLHIKNKKIVASYEGKDKIVSQLKKLVK